MGKILGKLLDLTVTDDYDGTKKRIMEMSAAGAMLRDEEVKAAMQIVAKEVKKEIFHQVQFLNESYTDI